MQLPKEWVNGEEPSPEAQALEVALALLYVTRARLAEAERQLAAEKTKHTKRRKLAYQLLDSGPLRSAKVRISATLRC